MYFAFKLCRFVLTKPAGIIQAIKLKCKRNFGSLLLLECKYLLSVNRKLLSSVEENMVVETKTDVCKSSLFSHY